ncbi:hypothetical protein [Candidatus Tisiphia endosymbiont of Oplodontha viridula]|uniref:hypothetical protein n=1 Tax=Candidatus Tisiphia endosymbiont of Oplodontha viridula TaxID=3077925 RepID=UPI0035C88012
MTYEPYNSSLREATLVATKQSMIKYGMLCRHSLPRNDGVILVRVSYISNSG